jgi:hypothetical protein
MVSRETYPQFGQVNSDVVIIAPSGLALASQAAAAARAMSELAAQGHDYRGVETLCCY